MPSAATTRPTSRTVSSMARRWAVPDPGPATLSRVASDTLNSAEHQPPLRPDAPKPATSRSSTAMRSPGSARLR